MDVDELRELLDQLSFDGYGGEIPMIPSQTGGYMEISDIDLDEDTGRVTIT